MGKIPNLTNIFQRGWNHQLESVSFFEGRLAFPTPSQPPQPASASTLPIHGKVYDLIQQTGSSGSLSFQLAGAASTHSVGCYKQRVEYWNKNQRVLKIFFLKKKSKEGM